MKQWILTPEKYLKEEEARKLRTYLEEKAIVALARRKKAPVRDWMIADLALSSGLRASEMTHLELRDIYVGKSEQTLFIRNSKANKSRMVTIGEKLRKHLKEFIAWKEAVGEPIGPEDTLFRSERSPRMSLSAIQRRFKEWARACALDPRYSIHSTRHTYGTLLYKATKDLRLVQKQLGHSSSKTTEVYADVYPEETQKAVELLYA